MRPLATKHGHIISLLTMHPIVIGYHLIWTVYGWWLPNDPRGGTSRTVASDRIAALGELHYGRKVEQPASRDVRAFYRKGPGC